MGALLGEALYYIDRRWEAPDSNKRAIDREGGLILRSGFMQSSDPGDCELNHIVESGGYQ